MEEKRVMLRLLPENESRWGSWAVGVAQCGGLAGVTCSGRRLGLVGGGGQVVEEGMLVRGLEER